MVYAFIERKTLVETQQKFLHQCHRFWLNRFQKKGFWTMIVLRINEPVAMQSLYSMKGIRLLFVLTSLS